MLNPTPSCTANSDPHYLLAKGTQVREEDFGLLFYSMFGPRLFFLSCGRLLESIFFEGRMTLGQWLRKNHPQIVGSDSQKQTVLQQRLTDLEAKGVIIARTDNQ